ncbi:MAG: hypothetical protein J1E40_11810 [Oscillospiraceae bacterium]|nr:hypothetical protein [Oscillospiraceae bacterium]
MNKYNDVMSKLNEQIIKMNFDSALSIGLALCINDIHYFSDYQKQNNISEDIFSCFEQAVVNISKNKTDTDNYNFAPEYNKCSDFLENFFEEDNLLYDECVNLCSEILHLFDLIFTRDNKHIYEIIKLFYENKEAHFQNNFDNSDELTDKLLNNMSNIDLLLFDM